MNVILKQDNPENERDTGNFDFDVCVETKQDTFTILDSLGFRKIIDSINYGIDWEELIEDLGNDKARLFFIYLISSKDIEFEMKEYFLSEVFDYHGERKKFSEIFTDNDLKTFGRFCLENGLIKSGYLDKYNGFLEYIKDDIYTIVTSSNFKGVINKNVIKYLTVEQLETILLDKSNIKKFASTLGEGEIIKELNFSNRFQEKLIDFIIENHKEIIAINKKPKDNTYVKGIFNYTMSKLIINNPYYYFRKIVSLEQNKFNRIVQKTHFMAILHYFKATTTENRCNRYLIRRFFKKMVICISIDNINSSWRVDSYYKYIKIYYPEAFEKINMDKIYNKTSHVEKCPKDILIKKLLFDDNWFDKCFKMENIGILKSVLKTKEVQNYVLDNFSDGDILKFFILLEEKVYNIFDYKELIKTDFFNVLFHKVVGKDKKSRNYIKQIFGNRLLVKFIGYFLKDFVDLDNLKTNKNLQFILNLDYQIQNNIVDFIKFTRENKYFNFDFRLQDITPEFIRFIKNTFFVYKRENNWDNKIGDKKYKKFSRFDFHNIEKFFDIEVDNYHYFDIETQNKVKIETAVLYDEENINVYNNDIRTNLNILCREFNLPYKLSVFKDIEQGYNDYLGNDENNRIYLSNFLKTRGIGYKIIFIKKYFTKVYSREITINEVLSFLETSKEINPYKLELILLDNLELLDNYLDNFDIKEFIKKQEDNKLYLKEMPKGFYSLLSDSVNKIEFILKNFNNLSIEKIIKFYKHYKDNFVTEDIEYWDKKDHFMLYFRLYKDNRGKINKDNRIEIELNKLVLQNAFDIDNYVLLKGTLNYIVNITYFMGIEDVDILSYINEYKKSLNNLLIVTKGFLNRFLLREFVINKRDIKELKEVIKFTRVDFGKEEFQNIQTGNFLGQCLENKEKYKKIFAKYSDNFKELLVYNNRELKKQKKKYRHMIPSCIDLKRFYDNLEFILSHKGGVYLAYFIKTIECGDSIFNDFPVNEDNFLDFIENSNKPIFCFKSDKGFKTEGTPPWSKAWFLEKPERKEYLDKDIIKTFVKFGTIIGLGIIEGCQNANTLKIFYKYIFNHISVEKSRSSILQLGEVFNLILKKENYDILDELVNGEVFIGKEFKDFIEQYNISDKGRTILTLMIAREINFSFAIFNDKNGNKQIDNSSVKEMLLGVFTKFKRYKKVIDEYKEIPIETSIGIEYEVTESIATGYREVTGSNYKNDIEILSEYSGIANGNDAVHEIATKPTNNPYLLLLEFQLLQDLDFIDLNFKKEDYSKGARGLHVNLGGKNGIKLDEDSYFIENILLASNLGGLNAGEEINKTNNTKTHFGDRNAIFTKQQTKCVEYRNFSIDKAESFERLILSIFNLHIAKQLLENKKELCKEPVLDSFEDFVKGMYKNRSRLAASINPEYEKKSFMMEELSSSKTKIIYKFLKLKESIVKIVENHKDFLENEAITSEEEFELEKMIAIFVSNSPFIGIMKEVGIDVNYFKEIFEEQIESKKAFFEKLKKDNKNIGSLSKRQANILFGKYDLIIKPELQKIRSKNQELYKNIGKYLNGNIDDTIRKITNSKRFIRVINGDIGYLESLKIDVPELFEKITVELINKFTKINNLFIKKDSTNALSMLDTTFEDGETILDTRQTEMMIFDKLDKGIEQRKGYNVIQGASKQMITQAIQREILEFNENLDLNRCTFKFKTNSF